MKQLKIVLIAAVISILIGNGFIFAQTTTPPGADAVPDLFAPNIAGPGGFITTTGGAPFSALNPAQGGSQLRIVFDAGYLASSNFNLENISSIEAGALFPTKYGVFGGSVRYIGRFVNGSTGLSGFPIGNTFNGNFFAAKEVFPGMSVGIGLNYGFGSPLPEKLTITGDLGFHYNTGRKLGPFKNFTWALVLRSLGKSYFPTAIAPMGGISFDLVRIAGKNNKPDPFAINFKGDLGFPFLYSDPPYINMIAKIGLDFKIAEIISISTSWPGASGLNLRELTHDPEKNTGFSLIPSVGLMANISLKSKDKRVAGGKLPSDGDLQVSGAFKPLYENIYAFGGGVSWYVGVRDKKPPVIKTEKPVSEYFSPNHDGKADTISFPLSITDEKYVVSWEVEIKDEQGNIVRTIQNKEQRPVTINFKEFFKALGKVKKQVEVPPEFMWDGMIDEGGIAPDGKYFITIRSKDDSDNLAVSPVYTVIVKNTFPQIAITEMTDIQKIFNPMGGDKNTITFVPYGSKEDAWQGEIINAEGKTIRTFEPVEGEPVEQVWDGKDDEGEIAPDGVYTYRISATDRAQNYAKAEINNIILDGRPGSVFLINSASYIAPKENEPSALVDFTIRLSLQDGIESWKLELKDESGVSQRTFTGQARVPSNISWNGLDDSGAVREGIYSPEFTVRYSRGDEVKTNASAVIVDISGPVLSLAYTPEYFSPDNDGVDDELFINLSAKDASPIASWSVEIRDPESGAEFYRIEGKGSPSSRVTWNGKSGKGDLVQSATDYPYTFTAEDILGNSNSINGKIGVDVLVINDGENLRIMIPSIVFRPNYADFEGLSKEIVDNNNRILKRIAQILNKFRDYKVVIEGHANPTKAPGPARDREETDLKRISQARAQKVVDELIRNGVARNRLTALGVGGSRMVVPYDDKENNWKNRRVEFILVK